MKPQSEKATLQKSLGAQTLSRRIVFVCGEKGGVGKSLIARLLMDWFIHLKLRARGFDMDNSVGDFGTFYPDAVEPIDFDDLDNLDLFVSRINNEHEVLIVDLGARSSEKLHQWTHEFGLYPFAAERQWRVTFCFVLNTDEGSLMNLVRQVEITGDSVDYVIVKNPNRGTHFEQYEASNIRRRLLQELGGIEIACPLLPERAATAIAGKHLGWTALWQSPEVKLVVRQYVKTFRDQAFAAFKKGGLYLCGQEFTE